LGKTTRKKVTISFNTFEICVERGKAFAPYCDEDQRFREKQNVGVCESNSKSRSERRGGTLTHQKWSGALMDAEVKVVTGVTSSTLCTG
jgi:hypothetical protein